MIDNECCGSYGPVPPNDMRLKRGRRQEFEMLQLRPLLQVWQLWRL